MQTKQTLASLFGANKQALAKELTGLMLPKDVNKIQSVVTNYFDSLFNQGGEYRQNLSVSEDYILQAALSLLKAQQEMGRKLTEKEIEIKTSFAEEKKNQIESNPIEMFLSQKLDGTKTLIGAGGGAVFGKMALGSGWGAVFGAIAGTAIVLYLATKSGKKNVGENAKAITTKPKVEATIVNTEIDVTTFLNIIQQTCDSIDSLISTFRNQIQKVVNKYESQEKPTLERDYSLLLESIQSLLGVAYSQQPDGRRLTKMDERIEQVVDSLGSYGLEVVSFSEDKMSWFEQMESTKVDTPTMIYPAIIKNGILVKRGKVFVKA
ncbi:hypothetical protein NBH15_17110 [Parabacteroides sp. W1-Q-101]|uniref:hypothetical protein n=1 Tax=Parabacteroides TaxID=375288 RepID=UPI0020300D65|nr:MULTISPECIES: hypothetical protein [Parabacteroides]MCM0719992.1 hypothetical protein [Parabacteroides sp. W1-Q-101]